LPVAHPPSYIPGNTARSNTSSSIPAASPTARSIPPVRRKQSRARPSNIAKPGVPGRALPSKPKPKLGGPTKLAPLPAPTPVPVANTPRAPVPSETIDIREDTLKAGNRPGGNFGKPDLIMAFVFALIVVNGFTSGQFQSIAKVLTKQSTDIKTTRTSFLMIGGEIVFAIGLSLIAQIGDPAANFVLVFVFALWALWGVQNVKHIQSFMKGVKG